MKAVAQLSSNTIALLVGNGVSALLAFAYSAIIGRGLGPDGFGVYTATLAWLTPFILLADFGINTLITRDVAQQPHQAHTYLEESIQARRWLLILISALIYGAAPLLSRSAEVGQGIRLSVGLLFITPFFGAFTAIFRARHQMWLIAWLNIGMLGAQTLLALILLAFGANTDLIIVLNVFTSLGQLLVAAGIYQREQKIIATQNKVYMLQAAFPFAIAGLIAGIHSRLPFITLEQLAATTDVALYSAAWRLVEAGRLLPNALFGAAFPLFAALTTDHIKRRHAFLKMNYVLIIYGLAFGIIVSLLGETILVLSFGPSFAMAGQLLPILALGFFLNLLRAGYTLYWYALGAEAYTNIIALISLVIQVIFSIWMIAQWGILGAAVAQCLSDGLALAMLGLGMPKSIFTATLR